VKLGNTHSHSTASDGELSPEEVILKAIKLGWDYIYFTDHYFSPAKEKTLKFFHNFFKKDYIEEVRELKEKYKNQIKIFLGAEFDWFEGYADWVKKQSKSETFDYVIGSVHYLKKGKEYAPLENGKKYWIKTAKIFSGNEQYVKEYYKQIKNMIKSGIYDCVAHLDHIKLYNQEGDLFSEKSDWYRKEVLEVLDLIKKNKMILELNTSGWRKCNMLFPSPWIVKEAKKRNIPITVSLDSHKKEHLDNTELKRIIEFARNVGYNFIIRFENRKRIKEKI